MDRIMKLQKTDWTYHGDVEVYNVTRKLGNGSYYVIRDGKAYPLCCYGGGLDLNVTITPLPFQNYEIVDQ